MRAASCWRERLPLQVVRHIEAVAPAAVLVHDDGADDLHAVGHIDGQLGRFELVLWCGATSIWWIEAKHGAHSRVSERAMDLSMADSLPDKSEVVDWCGRGMAGGVHPGNGCKSRRVSLLGDRKRQMMVLPRANLAKMPDIPGI